MLKRSEYLLLERFRKFTNRTWVVFFLICRNITEDNAEEKNSKTCKDEVLCVNELKDTWSVRYQMETVSIVQEQKNASHSFKYAFMTCFWFRSDW